MLCGVFVMSFVLNEFFGSGTVFVCVYTTKNHYSRLAKNIDKHTQCHAQYSLHSAVQFSEVNAWKVTGLNFDFNEHRHLFRNWARWHINKMLIGVHAMLAEMLYRIEKSVSPPQPANTVNAHCTGCTVDFHVLNLHPIFAPLNASSHQSYRGSFN